MFNVKGNWFVSPIHEYIIDQSKIIKRKTLYRFGLEIFEFIKPMLDPDCVLESTRPSKVISLIRPTLEDKVLDNIEKEHQPDLILTMYNKLWKEVAMMSNTPQLVQTTHSSQGV